MFSRLFKKQAQPNSKKSPLQSHDQYQKEKIDLLRKRGVKIGHSCTIYATEFSTEPYLIEIGDEVAIAAGVQFVTHNGVAILLRKRHPGIQVFGKIKVGSGTFIGMNAILLPNVTIGKNCIIGAGAVIRGTIADDSVVMGNPAQVVGKASDLLAKLEKDPHRLDVYHAPPAERQGLIQAHFAHHSFQRS